MQRSSDVVVIGGGIAGTAAALASARAGARVTLVRAAAGATALCMGGWQGEMPNPLEKEFEAVEHPWPRVSRDLPAPDGSLRSFERAATAQAEAQCGKGTLVCGITGLGGFRADVLARLWSDELEIEMHSARITLSDTPRTGWAPASLAARLERSHDDLARALAEQARQTRATSVILPAILGVDESEVLRSAIAMGVGCNVGEALGATPTIPGWRLQSAIERLLARASITVTTASVVDRRVDGAAITSIALRTRAGATEELQASAFVLATGKFIGGGIVARAELREFALNLPVWLDHLGERFESNEPLTLTNAERGEDQPLLGVGVLTDDNLQPLSQGGSVVYRNVWVAGAVRAGTEVGKSGLGAAATEGWSAGERAAG